MLSGLRVSKVFFPEKAKWKVSGLGANGEVGDGPDRPK